MTYTMGLYCLLFTYGFLLSYHLMGAVKYYSLKEFDWHKLGLGLINECGYVVFWLLIYLLPQYVDLSLIGADLDLGLIINTIMIIPLVQAIKKAYNKAIELKDIDVSEG